MSTSEQVPLSDQMQIETEEKILLNVKICFQLKYEVDNANVLRVEEQNNTQIKQLQVVGSYEIDKLFEKNIAKIQQDFLKNIEVYENGKYFYGQTEQMFVKIFQFDESQQSIQEVLSKKFPQPLYDTIMMKNKQDEDIIVISLYKLEQCSSESIQDEQTVNNMLNLKNIGYLSSQKKNTELYQTPLQFRYDNNKKTLFGSGKQFLISYDLNKFAIKDTYEKFDKSDIISCFDIPNANSTDYGTYKDIIAYGKFDRKIEIMDFQQKKIVNSFSLHLGGITCLRFDPQNSNYIYSGARKDDLIYLWDLRKQDTFVHYYQRKCTTNQRMSFDILTNTIAFGHQTGEITFANTQNQQTLAQNKIHDDCINSVRLFERDNKKYCLSASGQRHYNINDDSETSSDEDSSDDEIDMQMGRKKQKIEEEPKQMKDKSQNKQDKQQTNQQKPDNTIKLSLLTY